MFNYVRNCRSNAHQVYCEDSQQVYTIFSQSNDLVVQPRSQLCLKVSLETWLKLGYKQKKWTVTANDVKIYFFSSDVFEGDLHGRLLGLHLSSEGHLTGDLHLLLPSIRTFNLDLYTGWDALQFCLKLILPLESILMYNFVDWLLCSFFVWLVIVEKVRQISVYSVVFLCFFFVWLVIAEKVRQLSVYSAVLFPVFLLCLSCYCWESKAA